MVVLVGGAVSSRGRAIPVNVGRFRFADLPVCRSAKSKISFVSSPSKRIRLLYVRWTQTRLIVDVVNGQTGKPANRKATNIYQNLPLYSTEWFGVEVPAQSWVGVFLLARRHMSHSGVGVFSWARYPCNPVPALPLPPLEPECLVLESESCTGVPRS